jgi:hypothetical protein
MQQWPRAYVLRDEIYQMKDYSREKMRVLRFNASKQDLKNKNVHRTDRDFAVAWAKMYGKAAFTTPPWDTWKKMGQAGVPEDVDRSYQMVDQIGGCGRDLAAVTCKLAIVITRRPFAILTATVMASLPLRASASKLNVGIAAYSYHNLSMDEMIVQLTALEIEMSRGALMLMNHPAESMFYSAKAKRDTADIRYAFPTRSTQKLR